MQGYGGTNMIMEPVLQSNNPNMNGSVDTLGVCSDLRIAWWATLLARPRYSPGLLAHAPSH